MVSPGYLLIVATGSAVHHLKRTFDVFLIEGLRGSPRAPALSPTIE